MGKNFQQIYDNSIKNPEEFWKNNSEDIFLHEPEARESRINKLKRRIFFLIFNIHP